MRILAVTNLFPNPNEPGRAPFNRLSLRALAQQHALRVIAPVAWTDELAAMKRGGTWLGPDRRSCCDGIPVEHPRYWYPPKVLRNWYGHCFRWSVRAAFDRALASFRPDIVFASWAYPDGWAAVELGRAAGLPVVVKIHGSDVCTLDDVPARRRRTAEALTRADAVVAVSRDLARRAVALGAAPERVHVVYNGVDATRFYPGNRAAARLRLGLPPNEPLVLAVGRLVPVKGLDVLLEALDRMARAGVSFTALIVGYGPLRASLQCTAAARGLTGRVRLIGAVAHEELPDWYRAANVVALPSRSEGVPGVLLEAVACGIPFVASDVGGVAEIGHGGLGRLVPAGDPVALAAALTKVLAAPASSAKDCAHLPPGLDEPAEEVAALFESVIADHDYTSSGRRRLTEELQEVR